jgi:uncharacterized protein (UPF0332 family)
MPRFTRPKRSLSSGPARSPKAIRAFAAKDTPALDKTFSTFLAKAYSYKEIGDYRVDQGAIVTDAEAKDAIEAATRFIERVTRLLTGQ